MPFDAVVIADRSGTRSPPLVRRKRIDGRTTVGRRVKQLAAEYSARLGDAAASPIVEADIMQLAELQALTEDWRGRALRHEPVDIEILNRIESRAHRLRVALGVAGPPPAPPPPPLESYKQRKHEATP